MTDFTARQSHYADHLAPVWRALERPGRFYVPRDLEGRMRSLGVESTVYRGKEPPVGPLTVVSATQDLRRARAQGSRVVFMAHGCGQSFSGEHRGYAGGPHGVDCELILCVNAQHERVWLDAHPKARTAIVGCPKLDHWAEGRKPTGNAKPTVAVSFHWDAKARGNRVQETWTGWHYYRSAVEKLAERRDLTLLGHAHPRIRRPLRQWWEGFGVEFVPDFEDVLARADVYVNDASSTLFEASVLMPVVVLNIPAYRRGKHHGMRFWDCADVGVNVDGPADLEAGIRAALAEPLAVRERRLEIAGEVFPHLGGAADLAAAEIALLSEPPKGTNGV